MILVYVNGCGDILSSIWFVFKYIMMEKRLAWCIDVYVEKPNLIKELQIHVYTLVYLWRFFLKKLFQISG